MCWARSCITSPCLPFSDLPRALPLSFQVYRRLFEEQVITTLQEIGEVNEVADQLETGMWCEMDIGNSVLLHDLYSLKLNDLVRTYVSILVHVLVHVLALA